VVLFNVTAAVTEIPRLLRWSSLYPNSGMFVENPVVPPP
jgi:hypothetical protein